VAGGRREVHDEELQDLFVLFVNYYEGDKIMENGGQVMWQAWVRNLYRV
jgi:hypothetical protein